MPPAPSTPTYLSLLDRAFEKLGYRLEPFVPRSVTPNTITLIGFAGDLVAGAALFLAAGAPAWFAVAVAAIILHMIADAVDGAVARARGQSSKFGAFLDQMTDNFSFIVLPLGIGLSGQARMEVMVFGIIMILLHVILQYNWALLTERKVAPFFGSTDYEMTVIVTIVLVVLFPDVRLSIGSHAFNIFEIAFAVGAAGSFIDLCLSMRKLIGELRV
jgi:phosphatidylglycerophosphate synthase